MPEVLDRSLIDDIVQVTNDDAFETARLWPKPKVFLAGSRRVRPLGRPESRRRPEARGKTIVAILASTGERYISTELFED